MDFGTVIIATALIALVVAAVSFRGAGHVYRGLGAGDLTMEHERGGGAAAGADSPEAREEIRQLLEAKSARRQARGQPPLDVDAELEALTRSASAADPGLREEVRQLVVARNERRVRQGKEPLEVEAEVERQLRSIQG